ncbi:hypothetical protein BDZ90DRAFT_227220 [Jaminaea rosea]|uniref:Uncharacterized protein n=1 Tax=Jaminaea rosea TaxID=1569628 RepID=A0A316UQ80_9BASI|nr:hypothetical protein BDZ90DRAFT_227220 [Jaminaea rosea]PWN27459.1 hypothetical protein BDZ90DRAFT_227220 [Jaminaea rosea]
MSTSIRATDYDGATASNSTGMPASASACSLSAHRLPVPYHRRSDSANSSTSSNSSNSTAVAGLSARTNSLKRLGSASPSKQHAAVLLAAKRASMRGTPSKAAPSSFGSSSSSSGSSSALPVPIIVAPAPTPTPKPSASRSILMEDDYQEEVVAHMHSLEAKTLPNLELMNAQPELRWFMRPYLVDFLLEIHQTFRLRPETLYLTMNIVDRYVSKRIVFKRHYQLVGSAALLIATKYEDAKDRVPTVADLSSMCCQAYDESAFLQMEGHILQTLGWQLGHPTAEAWMRMLCREEDGRTQSVARFLMELTLYHRDFIGVAPSVIAAGALMLSRFVCQSNVTPLGMQTQQQQAGAREMTTSTWMGADVDEVASVAQMIDGIVAANLQEISATLVKKYGYQHFFAASTVVRSFYLTRMAAQKAAAARLLPAHSLRDGSAKQADEEDIDADCTMASSSSSSFSSGESTPSSMASTPSRSRDQELSDDDDEDDDEDMPVTPLSLTALHDPLAAAAVNMESPTMARVKAAAAPHYQQQASRHAPSKSLLTTTSTQQRPCMSGSQSMPRLPSFLAVNKASQPQHTNQPTQHPSAAMMKPSTSSSSLLPTSRSRSRLTLRNNPSWQT